MIWRQAPCVPYSASMAALLPAKLTVPMILFFLPVLFLVVLGPAYIKYQEMSAGNKAAIEAE